MVIGTEISCILFPCYPIIGTQSICTHYSCFENMGRFVTLEKNQVQNMGLKKAGSKTHGHCYSKREEAAWPLLFLNNNDPVFCSLFFSGPYFGPGFFLSSRP